jgi:hypothetical protein
MFMRDPDVGNSPERGRCQRGGAKQGPRLVEYLPHEPGIRKKDNRTSFDKYGSVGDHRDFHLSLLTIISSVVLLTVSTSKIDGVLLVVVLGDGKLVVPAAILVPTIRTPHAHVSASVGIASFGTCPMNLYIAQVQIAHQTATQVRIGALRSHHGQQGIGILLLNNRKSAQSHGGVVGRFYATEIQETRRQS